MAALKTAKYIRELPTRPAKHKEVTAPIPNLTADENFGNMGFHTYWECVTQPFTMNPDPHQHPFPQYLTFLSGDITNMIDLGGVIELTLGEDEKNLEKHTITKATMVYIPAGVYHCPLTYKKVTKPILFIDLFFAAKYKRDAKT
jgi:mannose-6-phosphate isomerase-like protein (cupin superfamily)